MVKAAMESVYTTKGEKVVKYKERPLRVGLRLGPVLVYAEGGVYKRT